MVQNNQDFIIAPGSVGWLGLANVVHHIAWGFSCGCGWGEAGAGAIKRLNWVPRQPVLSFFPYNLWASFFLHVVSQWGTWTSQMAVQTSRSEYSKRRKRKLPVLLKTRSKTYATYIPCGPCVSMHPRPARIQCGGTTQGIDTRRSWSLGFGRKIACLSSSQILKSRETISKCPLPDRPPQHQA